MLRSSAGRARDTSNAASRQDSLRFIARDNTDGLVVGSGGNLDAHISRIVDDVSSYYLLAYSSSNTKLDGRFRAITVRVRRDGVKVRARRGYRGSTADDLISGGGAPGKSGDRFSATAPPATGVNARAPFRIRTSAWLRDSTEDGPRAAAGAARAPSGSSANWTTRHGDSSNGPPVLRPRSSSWPLTAPKWCHARWI